MTKSLHANVSNQRSEKADEHRVVAIVALAFRSANALIDFFRVKEPFLAGALMNRGCSVRLYGTIQR